VLLLPLPLAAAAACAAAFSACRHRCHLVTHCCRVVFFRGTRAQQRQQLGLIVMATEVALSVEV